MDNMPQSSGYMAENNAKARKKLGVIGGMGPAATAHFYELLTNMADAGTDQDHLETYIISMPSIPDRTAFILGKSRDNPAVPIIKAGGMLTAMGVDYIAIPCVTSHCFFGELEKGIKAPLIHMVRETARYLALSGITCAGLLATDGTIASGLFSKELEARGIRTIVPSVKTQELVMDLIYGRIKANKEYSVGALEPVTGELMDKGADVIVLACTDLSLIKRDFKLSGDYIDALEVLARRSLELCGIPVFPDSR